MLNSISTAYRSWAFQVTIWLLLAAIAASLTFFVWVASAVKPDTDKKPKTAVASSVIDPSTKIAKSPPEEMKLNVKPVTFDAVIRDMRNYPAEFKDPNFVKQNNGKWTVQVMNVAEHGVITNYLNGRGDRQMFNYFRIVDENQQKRYILTYGLFATSQQAITTSQAINFGLPNNVSAFPEQVKLYQSQMDEYEIAEPIRDLGRNVPRDIQLNTTKTILPAPKAKPKKVEKKVETKSIEVKKVETKKVEKKTETKSVEVKKVNTEKSSSRSIEKSTDKNETLSIQREKKVVVKKDTEQREKERKEIQKKVAEQKAEKRAERKARQAAEAEKAKAKKEEKAKEVKEEKPKPKPKKEEKAKEDKPKPKPKPKKEEASAPASDNNDSMSELIREKSE